MGLGRRLSAPLFLKSLFLKLIRVGQRGVSVSLQSCYSANDGRTLTMDAWADTFKAAQKKLCQHIFITLLANGPDLVRMPSWIYDFLLY